MLWRFYHYVKHLFYLRHRKGHGIHAPYLFEFVHEVLFNQSNLEIPENIKRIHRTMRKDCSLIPQKDNEGFGAPSRADRAETRSISSIVKKSSVSYKYGAMLYRLTRWFKPEMILELGTGVGISAMYLSSGAPDVPMHTIEGGKIRALISEQVIKRSKLSNVQVHRGDLDQELEQMVEQLPGRFVAFVDANHRYDPTIRYVRSILEKAGEESVLILDDIYWSTEMQRAWREVIGWPEVRVSIDLFGMGIVLLRKEAQEAQVKINF